MKTTDPPVVVSQILDRSPRSVWEAITHHEKMVQWFFEELPDFRPEKGFYTEFPVQSGDRTFTHQWKIIEVIPQKSIAYTWKYKEYEGDSLLKMEVIPLESSTRLQLTHQTTEDFPSGIPEFNRESCLLGWRYFINERLTTFLK